MNSLKELVNKVYPELLQSDWVKEYPALLEKDMVSEILQGIALGLMPSFVESSKLEEFVDASEKNYKEETFKKYINNYSDFLEKVESEFYRNLLCGLTEE